jgi:hypothetical protein
MKSPWRLAARSAIQRAIEEATDDARADPKALRKHISGFYPFGQRAYHPYKIWCDEVNRQLRDMGPKDDPFFIRCRACGAGKRRPCKGEDFAHALLVAADAEFEGRLDEAKLIRLQAFHEARKADAGIAPSDETLPLFAEGER